VAVGQTPIGTALTRRSRAVDRAVAEQELRRGLEVGDHAGRVVDAADPADQRRQPHLLERAGDGEVTRGRRPLVHDAGDDAGHDLADLPHDVGLVGGAERAHHRPRHLGMALQRRRPA
jgi:hypothetical protein